MAVSALDTLASFLENVLREAAGAYIRVVAAALLTGWTAPHNFSSHQRVTAVRNQANYKGNFRNSYYTHSAPCVASVDLTCLGHCAAFACSEGYASASGIERVSSLAFVAVGAAGALFAVGCAGLASGAHRVVPVVASRANRGSAAAATTVFARSARRAGEISSLRTGT